MLCGLINIYLVHPLCSLIAIEDEYSYLDIVSCELGNLALAFLFVSGSFRSIVFQIIENNKVLFILNNRCKVGHFDDFVLISTIFFLS